MEENIHKPSQERRAEEHDQSISPFTKIKGFL